MDVIYGLALYFVLFSVIILIGGQKLYNRFNIFGAPWPVILGYAGLYISGAVCTGIVLETACTAGMWYSACCMIMSSIFKIYFAVVLLLRITVGEELWAYAIYAGNRFRVNAFMHLVALTGFGCLAAYIIIHSIYLFM